MYQTDRMHKKESKSKQAFVFSILFAAGTFVFDLLTPLGVAAAVPYVAVILFSLWLPKRRHTVLAGIAVSILTILGMLLSPPPVVKFVVVLINRSLSLFAIWAAVIFVSKYKHSLEVISESETRFRSLFESAMEGIVVFDKSERIVMLNPRAEQIFGYRGEELLGERIEILFPECFRDSVKCGANFYEGSRPLKMGQGFDLFPVEVSLSHFEMKDETFAIALITDVTEQKRAMDEIKRANIKLKKYAMELKRSNQELEQFAYVASHDLQEPLRMVSSFTQLLAKRYRDKLDDDANEFISYTVEGANRMQRLINDLLNYSRIQTRGKPFVETDCEEILGQVRANLQVAIEKSRALMTSDFLPTVMADPTQMMQLFQNLIDNAIKFSGKEPPRVHISAEKRDNEWVFSVSDNGIGIDPRFNERIFVIFQRLHEREKYPGTGIGLALCMRIVDRHGGRIWVESEPGKGSTFYFTIPAKGGKEDE
jgi:PAS domain S-box-containing protein